METIGNKVYLAKVEEHKIQHEVSSKDKINTKAKTINQTLQVTLSKEAEYKKKDNYSMSEDVKALKERLEQELESSENMKDGFMELAKIMEIARRIANGDKVPGKDEKKLLEHNPKLYMAVKQAASLRQNKKPKKYKSLYEDEEKSQEEISKENQEQTLKIEQEVNEEIKHSEGESTEEM